MDREQWRDLVNGIMGIENVLGMTENTFDAKEWKSELQ